MSRLRTRAERVVVVFGMLAIVLTLVTLQLWLFTASTNAWLGGDESVVWPAAGGSLACFALNLGLLVYLYRLEQT